MDTKIILLIDDDEAILSVFSVALENLGYRVVTASDGRQGLEQARKFLPDVILSDINMPATDGKQLLHELREDSALSSTQIVLMTGQPQSTSPRKGMELGADDFLVKPFSFDTLKRCVEARLARARVHWRVEEQVLEDIRADLRRCLPHEFFTPLTGIIGLADLLKSDWRSLADDEMDDLLAEIVRSGWRLQRTLRNYLWSVGDGAFAGATEEGDGALTSGEVEHVVREQAEAIAERHERTADLRLSGGGCEVARIGRMGLEVVVSELVDNACSFSAPGTPVHVGFRDGGYLLVKDCGRGMTDEQIRGLRAFHQIDRKYHEQQGLGLGLYVVASLLERAGYAWEIQSTPGEGTAVEIHLSPP